MRVIVVLVLSAGLAWFTYARLERLGRRSWPAALCRGVAWAALGLLLLDLSCAVHGGPTPRPLVLLDESLSMGAAGGHWTQARDSARAWGEVRGFGDAGAAADSLPALGRSALAPALAAAAASDRQVLVVSDGEVDDAADLPAEVLGRAGVRLFPRDSVPDVAILRVRGPDRVTAGDTIRLDAEVRAFGGAGDSARLEVRLEQRVVARRALRLARDGAATASLAFSSAGLSGPQLFSVTLTGSDAEPRDDARLWLVQVAPTPGVVLLADPPDWDARFLLQALRDVAQLPVRGYARLDPAHWRRMESLAPVPAEEVTQAARRADLLVLKGKVPELARGARARGQWLWASGEGGVTLIPGEWYASAPPASPVAGAFVGLPVDSFPPLFEITPIEPAAGDWVGLTAQLGRRGQERPIFTGRVRGNSRTVITAGDGLWRWQFRGGSSEQGYRALVASTLSWLLGGADSAQGRARPVRPVVANGLPLMFEWTGGGAPAPVGITVQLAGGARRDTLRFDGSGRAELRLPVGRYAYQLDGGGGGLLAVEQWSEEWLPRPVALHDRAPPTVAAAGYTSSRQWLWLFGLCLLALSGEWLLRRKLGLR